MDCRKLILALVLCGSSLLYGIPPLIAQQDKAAVTAPADGTQPDSKTQGPQAKGFFEILFSGGPVGVVIMLALIGLSLTAAYLVFDNVLSLRKTDLFPDPLADEIHTLLSAGRTDQAAERCRTQPCMLGFIMAQGLRETENGWSETEKALEEALAEQAARLYRRVEYLSVIGSLAPMLGLLGTVTGMLMAFQEVALSQGSAGAAELAEGIYQALVTTVVGLIIAIPALGAFAIFRNRVDQLVAEGAYMIQHAFGPLKKRANLSAAAGAGSLPSPPVVMPPGVANTADVPAPPPRAAPPREMKR